MIAFLIKVKENIIIALKALRQHPLRTILTTLGIIIGALTIISVASIVQGLNTAFEEQISFLGTKTLYVQKYPWMTQEWYKYRNRPNIKMKDYRFLKENLKSNPPIVPDITTQENIEYQENNLQNITITGAVKETEIVDNLNIAQGRFFSRHEIRRNQNKIVIGSEVSQKLFSDSSPIGKRVRIGNHSFYIIGILEKEGQFLGQSIDTRAYIPVGAFHKYLGSPRNISIKVKAPQGKDLDELEEQVHFLTRLSRGLRPGEEDNFSINKQDLLNQQYESLTSGLYTAAIGIAALSLLVGGIGIMNIMLVSVSERRKEVGIRKALGASQRVIVFQFLTEAIVVCSIGGVIAIILSYLAAWGIDQATPFPAQVPFWAIFLGLGFSSLIGIFFGFYPARKAAKLDPIKTLHYE